MKKTAIWLVAMALASAAVLNGCGCNNQADKKPNSGTTASTTTTVASDEQNGDGSSDATTTTKKTGSTTTTTTTKAPDNVIDFEQFFGDDTTTTTTTAKVENGTTGTTSTTKPTTTTTKPTTTTTLKPTTIDKVSLPAENSDVDGRGRIFLKGVALKDGVATLTIRNCTDEQKTQWITEETNYVTYACYDKKGNQLEGKGEMFGYLYLGSLEAGEEVSFNITLPKGTTSLELTGAKIVYWTPWS